MAFDKMSSDQFNKAANTPKSGQKAHKKRGEMARKLATGFKNFESMRAKKSHEILRESSKGE